jgi:hypothetical protein
VWGASSAAAQEVIEVDSTEVTIDMTGDADERSFEVTARLLKAADSQRLDYVVRIGQANVPACVFTATVSGQANDTVEIEFVHTATPSCPLSEFDNGFTLIAAEPAASSLPTLSATIRSDESFVLGGEWLAPAIVALVAAVTLIAVPAVRHLHHRYRKVEDDGATLSFPELPPEISLDVKESWLSNVTAVGALLTTAVSATDALGVFGVTKKETNVFLAVNLAAVLLVGAAPVIYRASRGYVAAAVRTRRERISVVLGRGATGERTVALDLDTSLSSSRAQIVRWSSADEVAVTYRPTIDGVVGDQPVTVTVPSDEDVPAPARLAYFVDYPTEEEVQRSRRATGTYTGHYLASFATTAAVGVQLCALWVLVGHTNLTGAARHLAFTLVLVLGVAAGVYVVRSLWFLTDTVSAAKASESSPPSTASGPKIAVRPDSLTPKECAGRFLETVSPLQPVLVFIDSDPTSSPLNVVAARVETQPMASPVRTFVATLL